MKIDVIFYRRRLHWSRIWTNVQKVLFSSKYFNLRRFGAKVTLIEQNATFLPHEDRDIADTVAQIFKEDGIDVLTHSKALKAEQVYRFFQAN